MECLKAILVDAFRGFHKSIPCIGGVGDGDAVAAYAVVCVPVCIPVAVVAAVLLSEPVYVIGLLGVSEPIDEPLCEAALPLTVGSGLTVVMLIDMPVDPAVLEGRRLHKVVVCQAKILRKCCTDE